MPAAAVVALGVAACSSVPERVVVRCPVVLPAVNCPDWPSAEVTTLRELYNAYSDGRFVHAECKDAVETLLRTYARCQSE